MHRFTTQSKGEIPQHPLAKAIVAVVWFEPSDHTWSLNNSSSSTQCLTCPYWGAVCRLTDRNIGLLLHHSPKVCIHTQQVTVFLLSLPAHPNPESDVPYHLHTSGPAPVPRALLYAQVRQYREEHATALVQKPRLKEALWFFLRIPDRTAHTPPLTPLLGTFWQCLHQILKTPLEKHPEELPQPYTLPVLCSLCRIPVDR